MKQEEKTDGMPVTTDISMLRDKTIYQLYLIKKDKIYNKSEIKVVAKMCRVDFIEARNRLSNSVVLIAEGNVYEMRDLLQIISGYDVLYEVKPSYPY